MLERFAMKNLLDLVEQLDIGEEGIEPLLIFNFCDNKESQ